jgi:hypothetical protein
MADPIALELLQSAIPARLAYLARDGSPRAIPIGFHWNGSRIILGDRRPSAVFRAPRRHDSIIKTQAQEELRHRRRAHRPDSSGDLVATSDPSDIQRLLDTRRIAAVTVLV